MTGSEAAASLLVVCPHCHTTNRLQRADLDKAADCGRCHKPLFAGEPVALDGTSFDRHVGRGELPVLVDFWAPWCGPCLQMAPHFAQAARALEPRVRLAKVDTEAHQPLAARFGIRSIPTLALFLGGREIARQAGAMPAGDIVRWVDAHLPPQAR